MQIALKVRGCKMHVYMFAIRAQHEQYIYSYSYQYKNSCFIKINDKGMNFKVRER